MYVDFASDWPAYLFMALFVFFFAYVIVVTRKQHGKHHDAGKKK